MKLIKYEAEWCSGCKGQDTILEQLKDIDIVHINVDDNPEVATKDGIRSLPTMILKDEEDNEVKRFVGVTTADKIKEFIK